MGLDRVIPVQWVKRAYHTLARPRPRQLSRTGVFYFRHLAGRPAPSAGYSSPLVHFSSPGWLSCFDFGFGFGFFCRLNLFRVVHCLLGFQWKLPEIADGLQLGMRPNFDDAIKEPRI